MNYLVAGAGFEPTTFGFMTRRGLDIPYPLLTKSGPIAYTNAFFQDANRAIWLEARVCPNLSS